MRKYWGNNLINNKLCKYMQWWDVTPICLFSQRWNLIHTSSCTQGWIYKRCMFRHTWNLIQARETPYAGKGEEAQWLSCRVLDTRPRGRGFEPHRCHCVVSLSKNINPRLVLVQPRKTHPFVTEILLMGSKESNQRNKRARVKPYTGKGETLYINILDVSIK